MPSSMIHVSEEDKKIMRELREKAPYSWMCSSTAYDLRAKYCGQQLLVFNDAITAFFDGVLGAK